ncbi:hypothetical protein D1AOALGA4SA_1976 [Olavius algarvensis Delta 1 endosymbiont]|nr:hypothetical protein D1AOALGA4SA_1976 [Olavius algarvensis Delta 1 endosymbiont]
MFSLQVVFCLCIPEDGFAAPWVKDIKISILPQNAQIIFSIEEIISGIEQTPKICGIELA